jgi:hypothetical protein
MMIWLVFTLAAPPPVVTVAFRDLLEPSGRGLRPSAHVLSLSGRRVRMVGYMAQMEDPPKGGFYLCASPVAAMEGGGGTADLPPDAVFVVVKSAKQNSLAHVRKQLEVTGVLEVGPQVDDDGRVSNIRILLEGPAPHERPPARNH